MPTSANFLYLICNFYYIIYDFIYFICNLLNCNTISYILPYSKLISLKIRDSFKSPLSCIQYSLFLPAD